jgi:hypothetical protein
MNKAELLKIVESIRQQTPRGWILMSPNSVGEVLVTCGFAKALTEKYGYPITLCVTPLHAPLVKALYPDRFTAVVPMDQGVMRAFASPEFNTRERFDIDFPIVLSPVHYGGERLLALYTLIFTRNGSSGLSMPDLWRYMLHLDWDTPMEKPCTDIFQGDNSLLSKLGLQNKKYVLLQPGNNTNKPLPASFWESLESHYVKEGCEIIINAKGAMLIDRKLKLKHARQVDLDIAEATVVAYHSHCLASGGNGLLMVAGFLDYLQRKPPILHSLVTDKYCNRYDKISTDWDNAFVTYDGNPCTYTSHPEMLSFSANLSEWFVKTDLNPKAYKEVARDVFLNDEKSKFRVQEPRNYTDRNFTEPLPYI